MPTLKLPDDLVRELAREDDDETPMDELRDRLDGDDEAIRDATVKALIGGLKGPPAQWMACAHLLASAPGVWPESLATRAFEAVVDGAPKAEDDDSVDLLGLLGVHAVYDVPALGDALQPLLQHQSPGMRAVASVIWGRTQPADSDWLVPLLEDPDPLVQRAARDAAISLAPEAPQLWVPQLVKLLPTLESDARCDTLATMRGALAEGVDIDADSKRRLLEASLKLVGDDDPPTRVEALAMLGVVGQGDAKAVTALQKGLSDVAADAASAAAVALLRLQPSKEAAARLEQSARSDEPEAYNSVITSLETLGDELLSRAASAIEALRTHADGYVRESGEELHQRMIPPPN